MLPDERIPFHFINVLWGRTFTDLFLDVALPNALSPRNLGAFPAREASLYSVYTTAADAERIVASPAWARLASLMPVEINPIDEGDLQRENYHLALSECHKQAIEKASRAAAAAVFLCPDIICSDGTFEALWRAAQGGARVVLVVGLRLQREDVVPLVRRRYFSRDDQALTIAARELAGLALEHLHSIIRDSFWTAERFTVHPSVMFWPVGDEGLVSWCFHLHPLMVRFGLAPVEFSDTIDGELIRSVAPERRQIHLVDDSDECLVCELSPHSHQFPSGGRASVERVAIWTENWADAYHRQHVRRTIRIHRGERSPAWAAVEAEAERTVEAILRDVARLARHRAIAWFRLRLRRLRAAAAGRVRIFGSAAGAWVRYQRFFMAGAARRAGRLCRRGAAMAKRAGRKLGVAPIRLGARGLRRAGTAARRAFELARQAVTFPFRLKTLRIPDVVSDELMEAQTGLRYLSAGIAAWQRTRYMRAFMNLTVARRYRAVAREALMARGKLCALRGYDAQAIQDFREAAALAHDHECCAALADAYFRAGDTEQGMGWLALSLEQAPAPAALEAVHKDLHALEAELARLGRLLRSPERRGDVASLCFHGRLDSRGVLETLRAYARALRLLETGEEPGAPSRAQQVACIMRSRANDGGPCDDRKDQRAPVSDPG